MPGPVFISLGTNLGNRAANLRTARESLSPEVQILQASSIYVTPPWGFEDQPEFLNQVLETHTDLAPLPLLHKLKDIETAMGRLESFRFGPRLIDLDILFYGEQIFQHDDLDIPHLRLHERAFVLVPLHEIAPNFVHPALGESIAELLTKINMEGVRRL